MNAIKSFLIRHPAVVLFSVAFVLLFMNMVDHRLSVLPTERFIENEYPSERFVIQRLVYDQTHDAADYGGLMIAFEGNDNLVPFDRTTPEGFAVKEKEITDKIKAGEKPQIYPSHAAFQLDLLGPLWRGMTSVRDMALTHIKPESRTAKKLTHDFAYYLYRMSQGFAAALSAMVLGLFVLWVRREFTMATAYLTLAGLLLFLPPLTYFGRNIWWMMGLWFVPMVVVFWGYALSKDNAPKLLSLMVIGVLAGAGTFMRVSCGYEYASTVMMSALVPVVYYNVKTQAGKSAWTASLLIIGGLVFCGFAGAIYHHYLVLDHAGFDAVGTIKDRFLSRSSNATASGDDLIAESVRASVFTVIAKYLFEPQKIAPPEILYLLPVFLCWKKWRENAALFAAMFAAFIGAVSMFVILKGHAYIHGFDTVAWCIPLNILIILWGAVQITKMPVLTTHRQ